MYVQQDKLVRWKIEDGKPIPLLRLRDTHPAPCVRVFQKWRHGTDAGWGESDGRGLGCIG